MPHRSTANRSSRAFIARPITKATTNYYASPAYLAKYGEPKKPRDIHKHRCILERRNSREDVNHWPFHTRAGVLELPVTAHYSADTFYFCMRMAEEGLGIAMLPDYRCDDLLASGKLVKLFNGKHEFEHDLYAVYPSRRYVPLKVKVFLDFLSANLDERL